MNKEEVRIMRRETRWKREAGGCRSMRRENVGVLGEKRWECDSEGGRSVRRENVGV